MEKKTINNDILFAEVISYLRKGHTTTITIKGSSMLPFLVEGKDLVTLEGIEAGTPEGEQRRKVRKNDIVLFRYHNKFILHRVLKVENEVALIRGDGNIVGTEICKTDQIYARVISILKNGSVETDPYSKRALRRVALWNYFYPVRRYLLGIYRRIWMRD